jgi:hypothetical protein
MIKEIFPEAERDLVDYTGERKKKWNILHKGNSLKLIRSELPGPGNKSSIYPKISTENICL